MQFEFFFQLLSYNYFVFEEDFAWLIRSCSFFILQTFTFILPLIIIFVCVSYVPIHI